jgi:hypothetical protein
MKSLTTVIVVVAALSSPGAMSLRSQQAIAPRPPVVALPAVEADEPDLAGALAEIQRHVEIELQPTLAVAAAEAGAAIQLEAAPGELEQQLASARGAIQLAQAAASAGPGASATTPFPATAQRLQAIVNKGHGVPGKALVIRTSDGDPKAQANLEVDLAVMSRILDNTVAKKLEDDRANRFMGINVLFAPGSGSIRNLYLEGYGALFLMNVGFPLLPPPAKPEPTKEKSDTDSTWEQAKQELYGQSDPWTQAGKALKFSWSPGPQQDYDKDKVDNLKDSVLEALKNATNIRNLKADESITVCVFGGVNAAPGKVRTWVKRAPGAPDADAEDVVVTEHDGGPPGRGTIMTIRVKKSDADAFAKGKLTLDDFRKKASVTTYAGDTGGWSSASVFGAPY